MIPVQTTVVKTSVWWYAPEPVIGRVPPLYALEERGFAVQKQCEENRRIVFVSITAAGPRSSRGTAVRGRRRPLARACPWHAAVPGKAVV